MNDWIPLDELVISEKENCITVDTRDFHCISHKIDMTKVNHHQAEDLVACGLFHDWGID